MKVALGCIAALGLLLFALGLNVSRARGADPQLGGYAPDQGSDIFKRMRAQGNTAEYAPMLAILILILGMRYPARWVEVVMGLAVVSRYLIAAGILMSETLAKTHPLRLVGAVGTYLTGIVLCIAVILSM